MATTASTTSNTSADPLADLAEALRGLSEADRLRLARLLKLGEWPAGPDGVGF